MDWRKDKGFKKPKGLDYGRETVSGRKVVKFYGLTEGQVDHVEKTLGIRSGDLCWVPYRAGKPEDGPKMDTPWDEIRRA